MKFAIVGSRKFGDLSRVAKLVEYLIQRWGTEIEIVSGGAKGVDTAAVNAAKSRKIAWKEFLPNPNIKPFVKAAMARNTQIVEYSDWVYAFYSVKADSTGTIDTMYKSIMAEKLVGIYTPKDSFQSTRIPGPK